MDRTKENLAHEFRVLSNLRLFLKTGRFQLNSDDCVAMTECVGYLSRNLEFVKHQLEVMEQKQETKENPENVTELKPAKKQSKVIGEPKK